MTVKFIQRPFSPLINFKLKYNNELLNELNRPLDWNKRYGLTQSGCMKNIRNLRYPLQAGREYTFSVMAGVIEGGEYRTLDVLPYLTTSVGDMMWCYGSEKVDPTTQLRTSLSSNAFPKYALGDSSEVG